MSANYGGTEIPDALEQVLRSRRTDIPTAVFVLTDGQVKGAHVYESSLADIVVSRLTIFMVRSAL